MCVCMGSIWFKGKITINTMRIAACTRRCESKSDERRHRTEWKTIVWSREHSRRDLACAPSDLMYKMCVSVSENRESTMQWYLRSAHHRIGTVSSLGAAFCAVAAKPSHALNLLSRFTTNCVSSTMMKTIILRPECTSAEKRFIYTLLDARFCECVLKIGPEICVKIKATARLYNVTDFSSQIYYWRKSLLTSLKIQLQQILMGYLANLIKHTNLLKKYSPFSFSETNE